MSSTLKTCFKCLRAKPLAEFYVHKQMADGHLNKCKECTKSDVRYHRKDNLEKVRSYDVARAKAPQRRAKNVARTRGRRAKGDGYMAAHNAVARAIKSGNLQRSPCQMCGTENHVHAHHDDYSKPLEVMWLCPIHHRARHDFLAYIEQETF